VADQYPIRYACLIGRDVFFASGLNVSTGVGDEISSEVLLYGGFFFFFVFFFTDLVSFSTVRGGGRIFFLFLFLLYGGRTDLFSFSFSTVRGADGSFFFFFLIFLADQVFFRSMVAVVRHGDRHDTHAELSVGLL
jgi:hypothetical protein